MKYTLENGRSITIDDAYMEKNMKVLNLTKEEFIQMYLADEGYIVNEEQQELVEKTKGQKITGAKTSKERKARANTKKVDKVKKSIIEYLETVLRDCEDIQFENISITNDQKIIEFEVNGDSFKLDLVKKRKEKAGN